MRAAILACMVAAGAVWAGGNFTRWTKNTATELPLFSFSTATTPTSGDICDAVTTADQAGAWFCLRGDGTMASGSQLTLGDAGSPQVDAKAVCPNGSDCTAVNQVGPLNGSSEFFLSPATGAVDGGSSFTSCVAHYNDPVVAPPSFNVGALMAKDNGSARTLFVRYERSGASATAGMYVFKGGGFAYTESALTNGVGTLICNTYNGSDGYVREYLNASLAHTSLGTQAAPLDYTAAIGLSVGAMWNGDYKDVGKYQGAFFTEKLLSTDDQTRLLNKFAPATVTTSVGALTFARASVASCVSSSLSGNHIRSGQPCVTNGGLFVGRQKALLLLRADNLTNAAWSDVGTPAAAQYTGAKDPYGFYNSYTLTDNDGAAKEGRSQSVATTSETKFTLGCWLRGGTSTDYTLSMAGTGNTAGDTTCTGTGLSTTAWEWKTCTASSAYAAGISAVLFSVLVGDAVGDTGTMRVAGCQAIAEDRLDHLSFTRSDGTAVTRNRETASISLALASGIRSAAVSYGTPSAFDGTNLHRAMKVRVDANNEFEMYVDASSKLVCSWTVAGSGYTGTSSASVSNSATNVLKCNYDGTNVQTCVGGSCNNTARSFTPFTGAATVYLGSSNTTGLEADGTIGGACLHKTTGACP